MSAAHSKLGFTPKPLQQIFKEQWLIADTSSTINMVYSIFALSYQLPEASGFPQAKTVAPDFTLTDQNGEQVTLSDYRGKKVVVVFYRGNW